ncbi:MAG: hypothetical protein WC350_01955 [Candidatus Micrarchaeia archaeon]
MLEDIFYDNPIVMSRVLGYVSNLPPYPFDVNEICKTSGIRGKASAYRTIPKLVGWGLIKRYKKFGKTQTYLVNRKSRELVYLHEFVRGIAAHEIKRISNQKK